MFKMGLKNCCFVLCCVFFSNICFPQESPSIGIQFDHKSSWEQIKEIAKKEGKYIFVDCFATWCGPCKEMDKSIYPLQIVGDSVNRHFISVKVQIDTSKNDDEYTKSWYRQAKYLADLYHVNSLPTFLFFS